MWPRHLETRLVGEDDVLCPVIHLTVSPLEKGKNLLRLLYPKPPFWIKMETMEILRTLQEKKDAMEKELMDTRNYLDNLGVGTNGPLVDNEGYPRSDIDLYAVRNSRHRVNCLVNDLRTLMKEIEEQLHVLHSAQGSGSSGDQNGHKADADGDEKDEENMDAGNATNPAPRRTSNTPFLSIADVAPGSPASNAGLHNGDLVIQFGSLCHTNFTRIQQVAEVVQNSVERPIRLTVLRDGRAVRLSITPKRWSGQGLLGCRAIPYHG